jgi:hypothetical protein
VGQQGNILKLGVIAQKKKEMYEEARKLLGQSMNIYH